MIGQSVGLHPDLCSEDPVVFIVFLAAVDVGLQLAVLRQLPCDVQRLTLPGLVDVAHGHLPDGMIPVIFRRQQIFIKATFVPVRRWNVLLRLH